MFTTNANPSQPSNDKIFTIEESQKAKRKSISFCMNEENMKDMTFYQNYFNNEVSFQRSGEHSKAAPAPPGLAMGLGQSLNQNSGLMNNSSFNLLFGHLDDTTKPAQPNSFMVESGDKHTNLIIDNFAIPNLAPQESQYAGLRRNLRNYNRSRHNDSDQFKNGSFGSNDSLSNLQKNLRDFRLGGSAQSSRTNQTSRTRAATHRPIGWTD